MVHLHTRGSRWGNPDDQVLRQGRTHATATTAKDVMMAQATECQTPDARYTISVSNKGISVSVVFPLDWKFNLPREEVELIEANLHNAVELVLAPYFK